MIKTTALTITQMIEAVSEYSIGTDITEEKLAVLQQIVSMDLVRINPGFSSDDLTELEAYLILDRLASSDPSSNIKTEKVKDTSWTFRDTATTSTWMDKALYKILNYNKNTQLFGVVERCDSEMPSLAADQIQIETYGDFDV